jgi:hypothetical protein
MIVYITQELNNNTGTGINLFPSGIKFRRYTNGVYSWVSSGVPVSVGNWQRISIVMNLDAQTYSAYTGDNAEIQICSNVTYSPSLSYVNMLDFSPQGTTNSISYVDDVSMKWVPTLHYTHKPRNKYMSESFESHTEYQTVHNTAPDLGQIWKVNPSTQQNLFRIERDLSFANGWKCLMSPTLNDGTTISSNDGSKLTLDVNNIVTMDLDVYVEAGKSAVFSIAKSSSGPDSAAIQITPNDSTTAKIKCWNGSSWTDTGKTLVYGVWHHFQAAMDCSKRTYKVVAQESGFMPVLLGSYNWGNETQVGDNVVFKIGCMGTLTGAYPYIYYDNIEVRYGLPNECGDEYHPQPYGDVSGDCKVNMLDMFQLAESWLGSVPPVDAGMDLVKDNFINMNDFAALVGAWVSCTSNCN